MKVWKIASRWSGDGNSNSVLELFRKHKIAFVNNDKIRTKEVLIGDLLAISDGIKIVSIGKVLNEVLAIDKFNIHELNSYNDDNCGVGFKIELFDLNETDIFDYKHRGRFHELYDDYYKRVSKLWENRNKNFSINAKTCTLKYNNQNEGETILNKNIKYIIPIYQRPYSWTDVQINKFINDIFLSYWGIENKVIKEPMFIGTMQLSDKHFSPKNSFKLEQKIIDGQQRLTTFLILIKVLKTIYPDCQELNSISLDWLKTEVNNGGQQDYLDELLNCDLNNNIDTLNPYLKNAFLIIEQINEQIKDEMNNKIEFEIDDFVKYVLSNIYFVVIETYAGLSKTLQIFDAINTTGLDLNGSDIFKIRMYEYLHDKKGQSDNAFNEISALYEKIEKQNKEINRTVTDIRGILSIYQYILIAKYDLPNVLYNLGTDTFFERLFDSIFNINQWEHFKNIQNVELDLKEIDKIIDLRYYWNNELKFSTAEEQCSMRLIGWSRYGKYWLLVFVFLFRFKEDENHIEKLSLFVRQLSKLFSLYSLLFLKAIGEIHTFSYSLTKSILNEPFDIIIEMINNKISSSTNYRGVNKQVLQNDLNGNIVYNAKIKNIFCRLSAMLDENFISKDKIEIDEITNKLFCYEIDIEHIQAYNDIEESKRDRIWKEWGNDINSIGNLMVLEQDINRSIGNEEYQIKTQKERGKSYHNSKFKIVENQIKNYTQWDLANCKIRKQIEIKKIVDYIFGKE